MRCVMFTYVHPDDAATWEAMTAEEQAEDVDRHHAWFGKWREHVVSGEELDQPKFVKTLRPGRQEEGIAITDGPFVESKEFLGGFVVVDVTDIDEAVAMASEWPSLATQPHSVVQVQPIYVRE